MTHAFVSACAAALAGLVPAFAGAEEAGKPDRIEPGAYHLVQKDLRFGEVASLMVSGGPGSDLDFVVLDGRGYEVVRSVNYASFEYRDWMVEDSKVLILIYNVGSQATSFNMTLEYLDPATGDLIEENEEQV